jgi:transposase-like protein
MGVNPNALGLHRQRSMSACPFFRCPLSLRLAQEMLHERGVVVFYETDGCWALRFGAEYGRRLKN